MDSSRVPQTAFDRFRERKRQEKGRVHALKRSYEKKVLPRAAKSGDISAGDAQHPETEPASSTTVGTKRPRPRARDVSNAIEADPTRPTHEDDRPTSGLQHKRPRTTTTAATQPAEASSARTVRGPDRFEKARKAAEVHKREQANKDAERRAAEAADRRAREHRERMKLASQARTLKSGQPVMKHRIKNLLSRLKVGARS